MANPVTRWQIVARDPAAVAAFYKKLFGWTVRADNALGYRTLESGDDRGIDGGVWPSPPDGHSLVQLFIEVDDVDDALARATALGAQVIVPKSELPDGDTMAILLDPAGLSFGVMKSRR
jgi:hypothetical protein